MHRVVPNGAAGRGAQTEPAAQSPCARPSDDEHARAFTPQEERGTLFPASWAQVPAETVDAGADIDVMRPASAHLERTSTAVQTPGVRTMAPQEFVTLHAADP